MNGAKDGMPRQQCAPACADDPLDVDAITKQYDGFRAKRTELRRRRKVDDARRLVEDFDLVQCRRAEVAAQKADPTETRAFLVLLAVQLRDGRELPYAVREYLSNALIEAAKHPATAASALGLMRAKHRPESLSCRDVAIAFRIAELSATRLINPTRGGEGAIEIAAREAEVTDSVAEHAWKVHGKSIKEFLAHREVSPTT